MSEPLQLDPDRLSGLADAIASSATTVESIRDELLAMRVPAITQPLVDRATDLANDVRESASKTALLARRVVAAAVGADHAIGGGPAAAGLSGTRWWARPTTVAPAAPPPIDWAKLDESSEIRLTFAKLLESFEAEVWKRIPSDARWRLISECPDLVAKWIPRGDLSADEFEALLEALAFDEFTDKYFFTGKGRVPMELFDVVAIADFDLTVVRRSDGTVTITVSSNHGGGIGFSLGDAKVSGSADATSVQGETMTFEFESMEEAQEAIDALRAAAAGAVGVLAPKPSGWGLVELANPVAGAFGRFGRAYRAVTADTVEETLRRYGQQLDRVELEIAMARTVAGSGTLPSLGALALAGGNTFTASYSDDVHGDDDFLSVMVNLDGSLTPSTPLSAWTSQSGLNLIGKVKGSAGVEFRQYKDGQARLILSFNGEASGALERKAKQGSAQPPTPSTSKPGQPFGLERSDTEGRAAALVVDIPIDDSTLDAAEDLVRAMTNGDDPTPALDALYNAADITFTAEHVATDAVGGSAGKFGSAKVGHEERTTDDVYRKRPHGEWHSPSDLMDQLTD